MPNSQLRWAIKEVVRAESLRKDTQYLHNINNGLMGVIEQKNIQLRADSMSLSACDSAGAKINRAYVAEAAAHQKTKVKLVKAKKNVKIAGGGFLILLAVCIGQLLSAI